MRVDEFVTIALVQIAAGVSEAQQAAQKIGARVNPRLQSVPGGMGIVDRNTYTVLQNIEFDLAVTVQDAGKTKGELGMAVWPLKAGVGGASEPAHSVVNRVRFSVPLALPEHVETITRPKS